MNPLESLILPPFGALYSVVTRARTAAYQGGWLPVAKLPVPVISVGNLTTGGTGKTPLVEWVCRVVAADPERKRVCVLTRGYGRADARSQVVVSDGTRLLAGESESGDEPYLLAKNLIGQAAVISNSDRYAAGKWALENLGSEVFILDDGFQHLRLARDLDIVVVDATNPWGGGELLPIGRLREKRSGLKRAGCIVVTRTEQVKNMDPLKEEIAEISGSVPVFESRMVTTQIRNLDGANADLKALRSSRIAAFCGVGNPESFFAHLRGEGFAPVHTRSFRDHHHYTQADIDRLSEEAKTHKAKAFITTAKDATKLTSLRVEIPCFVLEIKIAIEQQDQLVKLIRAVVQQER